MFIFFELEIVFWDIILEYLFESNKRYIFIIVLLIIVKIRNIKFRGTFYKLVMYKMFK